MTILNEKGGRINGRLEMPNTHDILTGSTPDGKVTVSDKDTTCGNWTKSGEGSAIVDHHDRWGLRDVEVAWLQSGQPESFRRRGNVLLFCR